MIKSDREYRTMQIRKAEPTEEKDYIVEGHATTFDEPYELYRDGNYIVMEKVDHDAFKNTDMTDVVFMIDHEGRVYARTRNDSLHLETDDHGLNTRTDLSLTAASRDVYEAIQSGLYYGTLGSIRELIRGFTEEVFQMVNCSPVSARSQELIDGVIEKFEAERLRAAEIKESRRKLLEKIDSILEVSNEENR